MKGVETEFIKPQDRLGARIASKMKKRCDIVICALHDIELMNFVPVLIAVLSSFPVVNVLVAVQM